MGKSQEALEHGKEKQQIVKGAYSAASFAKTMEVLRVNGLPRGDSPGSLLYPYYSVRLSQSTIVTGPPGSGKSTLLDNIMLYLAVFAGWRFVICSTESAIEHHIARLMEIYLLKKFGTFDPDSGDDPQIYMTPGEYAEAYELVCDHFYFIDPADTGFTVDGIITVARQVYDSFEFQGMVLDPCNDIEHIRAKGISQTEYNSTMLQKLDDFSNELDIHLWFVAHTPKLTAVGSRHKNPAEVGGGAPEPIDELDGSGFASWKDKCDFAIVVHPSVGCGAPVTIEIEKVPHRQNCRSGWVELYRDLYCGRYVRD